jgi:hypothetical protein
MIFFFAIVALSRCLDRRRSEEEVVIAIAGKL